MGKPKTDDPEQSQRFISMARELAAEGGNDTLAKALKKIAPHARGKPAVPRAKTKRGRR